MFDFLFFLLNLVVPGIYITKIVKKTMMGHVVDKTFAYYSSSDFTLTPLDTEIMISFDFYGKPYECCCNSEDFEECIEYIYYKLQTPWSLKPKRTVEFAYLQNKGDDDHSVIEPVTNQILCLAGPYSDFYQDTKFESKKGSLHGSDGKILHMIDNFGVHSQLNDDTSRLR